LRHPPEDLAQRRTSPCAAAPTTSTRANWSSAASTPSIVRERVGELRCFPGNRAVPERRRRERERMSQGTWRHTPCTTAPRSTGPHVAVRGPDLPVAGPTPRQRPTDKPQDGRARARSSECSNKHLFSTRG
jgi:hypothetical protein